MGVVRGAAESGERGGGPQVGVVRGTAESGEGGGTTGGSGEGDHRWEW